MLLEASALQRRALLELAPHTAFIPSVYHPSQGTFLLTVSLAVSLPSLSLLSSLLLDGSSNSVVTDEIG